MKNKVSAEVHTALSPSTHQRSPGLKSRPSLSQFLGPLEDTGLWVEAPSFGDSGALVFGYKRVTEPADAELNYDSRLWGRAQSSMD